MANINKFIWLSAPIMVLMLSTHLLATVVTNWPVGDLAMMADTIVVVEVKSIALKEDGGTARSLLATFDKIKTLKGEPLTSPFKMVNVMGIDHAAKNLSLNFPEKTYFLIMGKSNGPGEIILRLAPYEKQLIALPNWIPLETLTSYSDILNALLSNPDILKYPNFVSFFSGLDQDIKGEINKDALDQIPSIVKDPLLRALERGNSVATDALISPLIPPKDAETGAIKIAEEFIQKLNGLDFIGLSKILTNDSPFNKVVSEMKSNNEMIKSFLPLDLQASKPPEIVITSDAINLVLYVSHGEKSRKMHLTLKLDKESHQLKVSDVYLDI